MKPGKQLCIALLAIAATIPAFAQNRPITADNITPMPPASSDLQIPAFEFAPTNDKVVRVRVLNNGNAAAGVCRLLLTVRKINGVAVGRQTHINVPALPAGKAVWLLLDAKSILPKNVSLESTTFKLNVDATDLVNELDENNNETWHNL